MATEPFGTAALLATFGVLLVVSAVFSRASQRVAVPLTLVFLGVGMLAGSEGIGGIPFSDYAFAFRLGSIALVLILFDGGLNTPVDTVREALLPSGVLATLGVVGTAGLVAWAAHALDFPWPHALLLGAIVSSTDAAAVFSVLRGSGIQLKRRVGVTLEVESGINDPMAVILTMATTRHILTPNEPLGWRLLLEVATEIAIGGAFGVAIGWASRQIIARVRLPAGGLYPAFTLGVAFLAFSLPTLLHGSGFLAVYLAAVMLGNGRLPYRLSLLRVHDALGWLSQITMFLVLGLLSYPSRLLGVAGVGLALALFLALVARPAVVALCLLPFRRYVKRDVAYVGWVGLRGAVPIILATFPVLSDAPGAKTVFDVVFFVVVVNAVLPGATVPWVTRRLALESGEPPPPPAVLEIESMQPLIGELVSFHIDETLAPCYSALRELPFPGGSSVVLIVRGRELVSPNGDTVLQPGDHAYMVTREEDRPLLHLLFGRSEDG
jgi:cell volume regulation protein A